MFLLLNFVGGKNGREENGIWWGIQNPLEIPVSILPKLEGLEDGFDIEDNKIKAFPFVSIFLFLHIFFSFTKQQHMIFNAKFQKKNKNGLAYWDQNEHIVVASLQSTEIKMFDHSYWVYDLCPATIFHEFALRFARIVFGPQLDVIYVIYLSSRRC